MKKFNKYVASAMACLMLSSGFALTSCSDDDDFGTQQYVGGVALNVFGPSPVARGGELRFLGSGLSQISSITIPGAGDITEINRISDNEIRITVPQSAEPGYVVLHYAKGDITTKTLLTFTEPISIESVSPLSVKAGDVVTIKGDYLNLIHEVLFADEVAVPETEFVSHSRYEIKVPVPAAAQTGKVIVSDGAEMPNWIYSEEEVTVTLPSADAVLDLTGAKPGQEINVKGKNLDLVTKVLMPNDDEVEFTVKGDVLTFILPANVNDGTIVMVPASGVKVACATIGVAVPEECVAVPAENVWAGDEIKIKGVNMELVTTVNFPGVADAAEPTAKSATEISVKLPEGITSGDIVLNTGSGATVNVAISTVKPANIVYDPANAALAGNLTVKGTNLDHVAKIKFADATEVEVANPTATEFSVIVPATLSAGSNNVAFVLTNGEVVEAPAIELTAPECAYATVLPGEDVEIRAGETMVLTIANADKLTGVKVNGSSVMYILNENTLIVQVPKAAGKNSTVTLVSSNGEISYNVAVIPATHVGMDIWTGMWDCGSWGGNQDLAWGGYDWSQVPAGAILTLYTTPTVAAGEWWCISLRHGDGWGNLPAPIPGQYDTPENGILAVQLDANVLADLVANGGMVITGQGYVLNKVTIEWEVSLETTLWEGNEDLAGWGNNYGVLDDAGAQLAEVGAKVGSTVRFYGKATDAEWQVKIEEGHWGGSYASFAGYAHDEFQAWDLDANGGCVSFQLTQEMLDNAYKQQWWGNVFIIHGQNFIFTKLTIE